MISDLLPNKANLTSDDVGKIIEFLHTLEDDQIDNIENIIPKRVPSGLPVTAVSIPY